MRIWNVKPTLLCNNHLLAEHRELHMIVGSINNPAMHKSLQGLITHKRVDIRIIQERHEQLVSEMSTRGMSHHSQLPNYDLSTELLAVQSSIELDIALNTADLYWRCVLCNALMRQQLSASEIIALEGFEFTEDQARLVNRVNRNAALRAKERKLKKKRELDDMVPRWL